MTEGKGRPVPSAHRGTDVALLTGVGCYVLWGLFPLFWPLLGRASAVEVLAHRMVWSFVAALLAILLLRQRWTWLRTMTPRRWLLLVIAALVISANWGVYIFAVNSGHVVEGSLGYFINPLVNLLFGRLFFSERLDRLGRVGAALAFVGVAVIAAGNWRTLWISLVLALSFGIYGALKKTIPIPPLPGLLVESGVMLLPALFFLVTLESSGRGHVGVPNYWWLFPVSGVVTLIPLWLFATAARGLPLGTLGVLQYIGPTIQFLLGLVVFGQRPSTVYWLGLVVVWVGCAVYLWGLRRRGRSRVRARS